MDEYGVVCFEKTVSFARGAGYPATHDPEATVDLAANTPMPMDKKSQKKAIECVMI